MAQYTASLKRRAAADGRDAQVDPPMLDYIFFHERAHRAFCDFLDARGVDFQESDDTLGSIVTVPAGLSDALVEEIDQYYDELLAEQEALMGEEGEGSATAINLELSDGTQIYAPVDGALLERVLEAVGPEALSELIDAVAFAVESACRTAPPHEDTKP